MHTVIILSKHSSDLLKDYRFLFKPFQKKNIISICDWNEAGTDLETAVPALYKIIKGRMQWRAVILDTEPAFGRKCGPAPDEKNPFDYPQEIYVPEDPAPSRVPLIQLSHMLCGYPSSPVTSFEDAYEYTDEITGETKRVRVSDLSEEEFYELTGKYKERLRKIYLETRVSEETESARKALEERYSFADERPQQVYLVSTRRHPDDEEHIYSSWKSPFEMEGSDFCRRNNYPGNCRFLCGELPNPENSRYVKELMEFWLAVLTLAINPIPASVLQAYRLYLLGTEISLENLSETLNDHLNKMEAAYTFVQERLQRNPEYSFGEKEKVVDRQHVPVIFDGVSGADLLIDTKHVGLSRGCPGDELLYWNEQIREKQAGINRFLKIPRRAIDKAAHDVKILADSYFDEEYELDRFQIADLKDELDALELQVLTCETRGVFDENRIRKELDKTDKQVKKEIDAHIRKGTAIASGAIILLIYLMGYLPYMMNSFRFGGKGFLASVALTAVAVLLSGTGGIAVLFLLRKKLVDSMKHYNDLTQVLVENVNESGKKFEEYFSLLSTFMKGQSVYDSAIKNSAKVSSKVLRLRTHKRALALSIERDEEIAEAFGVRRDAEFEKNVTQFFDEDKVPQDNALYYYEMDDGRTEIPLNTAGDLVQAPYRFIAGLTIKREDIYEDEKGGSR